MTPYIFNIGSNRSGTRSLTEALCILGIKSLHYTLGDLNLHQDIVLKNLKKNQKLFESVDRDYQGFSDFVGENYYQILYEQYPNSKFILTTRPFNDWCRSYEQLLVSERKIMKKKLLTSYKNAINIYYNKGIEIRSFFLDKPDQFLEIKICSGQGWETLCPFLGVDIPHVPFPYLNKLS